MRLRGYLDLIEETVNNYMRHYFLTRGLHPPWNTGEVVNARNFVKVLKKVSKGNLKVLSIIDASRYFGSSYEEGGVDYVQSLGNEYVDSIRLAIKFMKSANEEIDTNLIVHLSNVNYSVVLPLLKLYKKRKLTIIPHIYLLEHHYVTGVKATLNAYIVQKFLLKLADAILCTSPLLQKKLLKLNLKQTYYVPPPVCCDSFKSIERKAALEIINKRFNLNLDETEFIILYIGHISPVRFPYEDVMKAFVRLLNDGVPACLLIFAPKFYYNEAFKRGILLTAKSFNIERNVSLFVDNLEDKEKRAAFSLADVFLFLAQQPTAVDPPLTILEALTCGVPVIAYNMPSLLFIKNAENSFLIEDINELYQVLKDITINSRKNNYLKQEAKEAITQKFSPEKVIEELFRLYANIYKESQ